MTASFQTICTGDVLANSGLGVRFLVTIDGVTTSAFAVRYRDRVNAYLNRCAHKLVELDWEEGRFFDLEGEYLVCATHGARYKPENGVCMSGPCPGAMLAPLEVIEKDGEVFLVQQDGIHLIESDL